MKLFNFIKNLFVTSDKYKNHSEAVIIACYFNPENNPYRLIAFNKFYESIKHLNHRIVECVIGDAKPDEVIVAIWPYIAALLVGVVVIAAFSILSTFML